MSNFRVDMLQTSYLNDYACFGLVWIVSWMFRSDGIEGNGFTGLKTEQKAFQAKPVDWYLEPVDCFTYL